MNEINLIYVVEKSTTLADVLKGQLHISERLYHKIRKDYVTVNDSEPSRLVNSGDLVKVDFSYAEDNSNIVATEIPLDIVYEDEWMLIVNKPVGFAIHPSLNHYTDSLSNGIKFYFEQIGLHKKIRIVNRLDTDTSGLVIIAKCEYIQEQLSMQMQNNVFVKKYYALVEGHLDTSGQYVKIDKPIKRKADSIIERCVSDDGAEAVTFCKSLKYNEEKNITLVECKLQTGRTHQIRVHFKSIGFPILGDSLYNRKSDLISHQALHSYYLSFMHPISGEILEFEKDSDWIDIC